MGLADERRPVGNSWTKPVAALSAVFGVTTVFSGGNVLFGPEQAKIVAGDYVSFVVWFNFFAGFMYIAAAVGIWLIRDWAFGLARFIALATLLAGLAFTIQVAQGVPFEMRTVGALTLRFGFWTVVAMALGRNRCTS